MSEDRGRWCGDPPVRAPRGGLRAADGRARGSSSARRRGLAWSDIQFAYGGSEDGGNADTMVSDLGPTGLPFTNVKNGCATGGSSLVAAVRALQSGVHDVGLVVGFDKHPRGAFQNDPADWSLPRVVRRGRADGDDAVLRRQAPALHARSRDPAKTLAEVAVKAFANGSLTPHAWRRTPLSADDILASPMLAHPLTQYMLCSPGEGAAALVVATAEYAARLDARPVRLRSVGIPHAAARVIRGVQPLARTRDRALAER